MAGPRDSNGGDGMPRWVKLTAIIGAAIAMSILIMMVLGHGPGRHSGVGATTQLSQAASAGAIALKGDGR